MSESECKEVFDKTRSLFCLPLISTASTAEHLLQHQEVVNSTE